MIDGRYKGKQEINDGKSKIELFRTCELLIIDEIGRSLNNQKNEKEILFSVLNTRINEYLPTVLCSNLAERQLQEFSEMRSFPASNLLAECFVLMVLMICV